MPAPFVPGSEFAGVVEEVAEGVTDVAVGDRVSGAVLVGAFAEEVAASRGDAHVVNHRSIGLREVLRDLHPGGVDVVVDPVGGSLSEPALRSLRWGGRFVTVGYAAGEIPKIPLNLVLLKGASIHGFQLGAFAVNAPEELRRNDEELAKLFHSRRVSPHIGASFPLADVVTAFETLASGRAVGKVVIDLEEEAD